MKKQVLILLLTNFICGIYGENLLKNGDFENGDERWNIPSWLKNTIVPKIDLTVNAGGGSKSLKLQGEKGKRGILYHNFLIPAGTQKLQISLMIKTQNLGRTYAGAYLEIQNVRKNLWSVSTYARSANKTETDWLEYKASVKLPEGYGSMAKIYLHMAPDATGTVWFDDISVIAESGVAPAITEQKINNVPKKSVDLKNDSFLFMTRSGENILLENWNKISWLSDAAPMTGEKENLEFRVVAGQRALTEQRIMAIEKNCTGVFRYSAWFKVPPGIFPAMSVSVYPIYTVSKKAEIYHAMPSGEEKNGFREYVCYFTAPATTGEIRTSIGISGKSVCSGSIKIKNIMLEPLFEKAKMISLWDSGNDARQGLFQAGETPFAKLKFKNQTGQKQKLKLFCSLRNIQGKEITTFEKILYLPPLSISTHKLEFPFPERYGFYSVHVRWKIFDKEQEKILSYAALPPFYEKADPVFGITFMARNKENAEAMRRLGTGTKGLFFQWDSIEQIDGSFNWENFDRDLESLQQAGIEVVGGIEITTMHIPARYQKEINQRLKEKKFPFSLEYYGAAARFEKELFRRYNGRIRHWAIIGEIDLLKHRNSYEYEHYIQRIKNCYQTMKQVAPKNTLSGIGCSGTDGNQLPRYPVLRDLWFRCGLSESLDGLGIDQYTNPHTYGPGYQPVNSETGKIREIMLEALQIARKAGKDKYISIDEKGFKIVQSLPLDSPYAVSMAENIARYYITVKGIPEIRHFLYFLWKRWRNGEEFDYGLWFDHFPRPGAAVYAITARLMANAKFLNRIDLHANIPCHIFEKDGKRLITLWHGGTGQGKAGVSMNLPQSLSLKDMEGNEIKPVIINGKLKLQLDSAPIYLITTSTSKEIEKIFRSAMIELPSVSMEMNLKRLNQLEILIKNLSPVPVSGTLSLNNSFVSWKKEYTLTGNEVRKIAVSLVKGSPVTLSREKFILKNITPQKQTFIKEEKFTVHTVPKITGQEILEQRKPLINLSNGELYLNIPDFINKGVWKGPSDCSAQMWMGYDLENLYLNIRVQDDIHCNIRDSADALWAGDSIQFAFDSLLDAKEKLLHGKNGLFDDDHLFTAALAKGKQLMFCRKSGCSADWSSTHPDILRDDKNRITAYRIILPWNKLKPLKPVPGTMFGFNFIVFDSDNPTKQPDYWLQLTPGIAGGQAPQMYHIFLLE